MIIPPTSFLPLLLLIAMGTGGFAYVLLVAYNARYKGTDESFKGQIMLYARVYWMVFAPLLLLAIAFTQIRNNYYNRSLYFPICLGFILVWYTFFISRFLKR